MDGPECLIFQEYCRVRFSGPHPGPLKRTLRRQEEAQVEFGVALVHRLRFEAGEQAKDRAGAGGAFALEALEGFAKALESFLHFHRLCSERSVLNPRDSS